MSQTRKTDFLGTEPIFPLLLKLGVPAAVGMFINALYNIVDTVFVGQGVGPLAIGALSIVFPLQMIVSAFAQAIAVGTASIISRRLGERRDEEAAGAAGSAITIVVLVTIVLVAIVFAFMPQTLRLFGATDAIMPYAIEYTQIVAGGFFFFAMSMCLNNLLRSEGHARIAMTGMILGAVLNMILDPIFIFGFGLGVRGAAIATVISQIVSASYLISFYIRRKSHVQVRVKHLRIQTRYLSESMFLGIPIFVQSAGMSLLALVVNNSLGHYGGDNAISIYGMIQRLVMVTIMPVLGISQGFQPIAGYNYGAGNTDRVRASLRIAILASFVVATCLWIVMILFPRICLGIFSRDTALVADGAVVLRVMIAFLPLVAVQITGSTYFQAVGKPRQSFVLGLSRQFIILIPLVLILPRFMGTWGVWSAYPLADILSVIITLVLLFRDLRHLKKTAV